MTQTYEAGSLGAALLQLSRIKGRLSQAQLARRAGVPATMISAYERGLRQPTLETLTKLLHAAGYELRLHLEPWDLHDATLAGIEALRSAAERKRRDSQLGAWRRAVEIAPGP